MNTGCLLPDEVVVRDAAKKAAFKYLVLTYKMGKKMLNELNDLKGQYNLLETQAKLVRTPKVQSKSQISL